MNDHPVGRTFMKHSKAKADAAAAEQRQTQRLWQRYVLQNRSEGRTHQAVCWGLCEYEHGGKKGTDNHNGAGSRPVPPLRNPRQHKRSGPSTSNRASPARGRLGGDDAALDNPRKNSEKEMQ